MIKLNPTRRTMLVLTVAIAGFIFHARGQAATIEDAVARFPVAHQHTNGWCLGYLYVYTDSIAYETTWPASDKSHSFTLRRSDLKQIGRWSRSGQSLKAVELKSGKTTYHFWWLPNEQDVINGRPYQSDPPDAGDPDPLIAGIRDPATLATDASPPAQMPAQADSGIAPPPQRITSPPASGLAALSAAAAPFSATPEETRFAVAHAHALVHCVGYLYVSSDHVRYEVVQPGGDKKHGFNLPRAEITSVQQWVLIGKPLNAAEIKTAHGSYHFWLLPDGSDLVNTPYRQWNVNSLVPVEPLIAALRGQH